MKRQTKEIEIGISEIISLVSVVISILAICSLNTA